MRRIAIVGGDIGTGSCKVVAFDTAGNLITSRTREYPILHPQWGWAEQEPKVVLKALAACFKDLFEIGRAHV